MTEKQKIFADEYLIDLNATLAYKMAYPNVKNDAVAAAAAARLLRNVKVKNYIAEQMEKIHNEKTADAQEVIEYLTSVLRGESTAQEIVVEGRHEGHDRRPESLLCSNAGWQGSNVWGSGDCKCK